MFSDPEPGEGIFCPSVTTANETTCHVQSSSSYGTGYQYVGTHRRCLLIREAARLWGKARGLCARFGVDMASSQARADSRQHNARATLEQDGSTQPSSIETRPIARPEQYLRPSSSTTPSSSRFDYRVL